MSSKKKMDEVKIRNLYYLLAYAFDEEKINFDEDRRFGIEEMSNIYDLFSIILFIRLKEILQNGKYYEYVEYNEDLSYIKGKIDILNSVRKESLKIKNRIICNFEEYSINNIINRIIKTTIVFLLKCNVCKENKIRLRYLYHNFEDVDCFNDIKQIPWDRIKFNRLNEKYKVIIKICEYILNNIVVNKEDDAEEFLTLQDSSYSKLFERFIRNYLRKYFLEYRKKPTDKFQIGSKKMQWDIDELDLKEAKYIPKMLTDITVSNRFKPEKVKIIDTKFYSNILSNKGINGMESTHINTNNWYQLFSYMMNEKWRREKIFSNRLKNNEIEISGMLLYANTGENFKNFRVRVHGKWMEVYVIDFTKKFGNPKVDKIDNNTIAGQMKILAEKIYEELS